MRYWLALVGVLSIVSIYVNPGMIAAIRAPAASAAVVALPEVAVPVAVFPRLAVPALHTPARATPLHLPARVPTVVRHQQRTLVKRVVHRTVRVPVVTSSYSVTPGATANAPAKPKPKHADPFAHVAVVTDETGAPPPTLSTAPAPAPTLANTAGGTVPPAPTATPQSDEAAQGLPQSAQAPAAGAGTTAGTTPDPAAPATPPAVYNETEAAAPTDTTAPTDATPPPADTTTTTAPVDTSAAPVDTTTPPADTPTTPPAATTAPSADTTAPPADTTTPTDAAAAATPAPPADTTAPPADPTTTATDTQTPAPVVGAAAPATPPAPAAPTTWQVTATDASSHTVAVTTTGSDITVTVDGAATTKAQADVSGLAIATGAGNDTISVDLGSLALPVTVDAGAGDDRLAGPSVATTWDVTGAGSGTVGSVSFSGVEHLAGAAGTNDAFVIHPGGSVASIAGGEGGSDSIAVAGAASVVSHPVDHSSGTLDVDGNTIAYSGLEPVGVSGTGSVTVSPGGTSIAGDTLDVSQDSSTSNIVVASHTASFGTHTIALGGLTNLSVDAFNSAAHGDIHFLTSILAPGVNLTAHGRHITVDPGVLIDVTKAGSADGAITFTADSNDDEPGIAVADFSAALDSGILATLGAASAAVGSASGYYRAPNALIAIDGGQLRGGNISLAATSTTAMDHSGPGVPGVSQVNVVNAHAEVDVGGASVLHSSGTITINASTTITATASWTPSTDPGGGAGADAAFAGNTIVSTTTAHISGTSILTSVGALSVRAATAATLTTNADGLGGSFALAQLVAKTLAYIDSSGTSSASTVEVAADARNSVTTSATAGGAGSAKTTIGGVNNPGALAVSYVGADTEASITHGDVTGSTIKVHAASSNTAATSAGGSAVKSPGAAGAGLAVAVEVAKATTKAWIGSTDLHATGGTTVEAPMFRDTADVPDTYSAIAEPGVGDATDVSAPGARAVLVVTNDRSALLDGGAVDAHGGDVTLTSTSGSSSVAKAAAAEDGVHPSVAVNILTDTTRAGITDGTDLLDAHDLTLTATTTDSMTTDGASGATSGGPPATAISTVETSALIGTGGTSCGSDGGRLCLTGALNATATQTVSSDVSANGANVSHHTVQATALRNVDVPGEVTFRAVGAPSSTSATLASASGADGNHTAGSAESVDSTTVGTVATAGIQPYATGGSPTTPEAGDSSAADVSVAVPIGYDLGHATSGATTGGGSWMHSGGNVTLRSKASTHTSATAHRGAAAAGATAVIAAAAAVNLAKITSSAGLSAGSDVGSHGLTLSAIASGTGAPSESKHGFSASAPSGARVGGAVMVAGAFATDIVDLDSNALLRSHAIRGPPVVDGSNGTPVFDPQFAVDGIEIETGDAVFSSGGGGEPIGGLPHGTTYVARVSAPARTALSDTGSSSAVDAYGNAAASQAITTGALSSGTSSTTSTFRGVADHGGFAGVVGGVAVLPPAALPTGAYRIGALPSADAPPGTSAKSDGIDALVGAAAGGAVGHGASVSIADAEFNTDALRGQHAAVTAGTRAGDDVTVHGRTGAVAPGLVLGGGVGGVTVGGQIVSTNGAATTWGNAVAAAGSTSATLEANGNGDATAGGAVGIAGSMPNAGVGVTPTANGGDITLTTATTNGTAAWNVMLTAVAGGAYGGPTLLP